MWESARKRRSRQPLGTAKWLAVASLAAIAACLLIEVGLSASVTHAQVGSAGGEKIMAVAGQMTRDSYGLYLVDIENARICMYQWRPATRTLRLMAARSYIYDLKLEDYNSEPPLHEVRQLVESRLPVRRAATRPH